MPFWPFASGWMLLWSLAAAVPIVIHLWNRRRHREVNWAAMEYLLAAIRNNARRLRMEQLILLAIRTLILILLAIALADPFLEGLPLIGEPSGKAGNTHYVLVIDGSYSMDYSVDGETCFSRAKKLAATLVAQTAQGDGLTVIRMSDPPQVVVAQAAFDPGDVLDELDRLELSHGGAELAATWAEIESLVDGIRKRYPRLQRTKVCFFTDLGRATWKDVETEALRASVARLADQASLVLFDVGRSPGQNLGITSATVEPAVATVMDSVTLRAEIANFGIQDWLQHPIELFVGGHKVAEQRVDARSGRTVGATFDYRFPVAGEHRVELRLGADPLELDNHRWIVVTVRDSLRVLCIEGSPGAARYAAWALDPSQPERARIDVQLAAENAVVERDLAEFDCVWICNIGSLGRGQRRALLEYASHGGGVVVCLGDRTDVTGFEPVEESANAARLLPATIDALSPTDAYAIDPLDYGHPIVGVFRGNERSGLLTTPVWKYVRCEPVAEATEVLALANGDVLMVEHAVGRGCCILLATAVSPNSMDRSTLPPTPWSALATWPSFPPLVQELLAFAIRGRAAHRNVLVGEPLVDWTPVSGSRLKLTTPNGRSERLATAMDGGALKWVYANTAWSGLYEVAADNEPETSTAMAVNLDGRESALDRYDLSQMPDQFARDLAASDVRQAPDVQLAINAPQSVFRQCLALVLVLLLAELFLGWFFGNAT